MNKIETFYGKISEVEDRVNDLLEYITDNNHHLIDLKQSIDTDPESIDLYVLMTVIYRTKEREQV